MYLENSRRVRGRQVDTQNSTSTPPTDQRRQQVPGCG